VPLLRGGALHVVERAEHADERAHQRLVVSLYYRRVPPRTQEEQRDDGREGGFRVEGGKVQSVQVRVESVVVAHCREPVGGVADSDR